MHKGLHLALCFAGAILEFLIVFEQGAPYFHFALPYYIAHPGTPVSLCVCGFIFISLENIHQQPPGKRQNGSTLQNLATVQIATVWQEEKQFGADLKLLTILFLPYVVSFSFLFSLYLKGVENNANVKSFYIGYLNRMII